MQGKRAVIELSNVISMSESYADELFAVLVAHYGLEWFANNIQLRHESPHAPHVLLSIATAIRRRLENQDSHEVKATIDGLIAAKKYANAHPVRPQ
jgi:hypothetical protein